MAATALSRLKQLLYLYPLPAFMVSALAQHKLMAAYRARPAYQQHDYIDWITRAELQPTRQKRLQQMLDELKGGELYMDMAFHEHDFSPSVTIRGKPRFGMPSNQ